MKSRRSRGRRRFRMAKRELIWVTTQVIRLPWNTTGPGTVFDLVSPIVSPSDWARDVTNTAVREKGAVLLRLVGDIWFQLDTVAGVASLRNFSRFDLIHGFVKRDVDDASAMDVAVDAFQEDWLQLHTECIDTAFDPTPTLSWWGGALHVHRQVDVKVKRKLTNDDTVALYATQLNATGLQNSPTVSAMVRALIQLP